MRSAIRASTARSASASPGPAIIAGTGALTGADPREMAKSDCVVIWGTNAVATQVNVMTHAIRARKERGAKIVAIDIYETETMRQADLALWLRPGTDGALACAVMHVLFRDGLADRDYLERYTDAPHELEAHLATRTPEWASAITGLGVAQIEEFAALVGRTKRTFFRLGYGFSRQRNGAANMHAALCIPAVTGAWAHEGGGAFHSNSGIFKLQKTMIEGLDVRDSSVRRLDQSRVGAMLTGEPEALKGGPPVKAMLVQNTNPLAVAPNQEKVRRGFAREDLFTCVHEQFMTDTARYADIVLPATMFLEHDDIYTAAATSTCNSRPRSIEPPEGCRSNHEVIVALARRLGAEHPAFAMTPREIIDWTLRESGCGDLARLEASAGSTCSRLSRNRISSTASALPDGKFRFKADWPHAPVANDGMRGPWQRNAEPARPLGGQRGRRRRAPVQARDLAGAQFPQFELHRDADLAFAGTATRSARQSRRRGGAWARRGRRRATRQRARPDAAARAALRGRAARGAVSEGIWPPSAFLDGWGINVLVGDDSVAPFGGVAFHDISVWARRA